MPPDVHVLGEQKAPLRAQWGEVHFEVIFFFLCIKFIQSEKATKCEGVSP
jgi:hypothetical protein